MEFTAVKKSDPDALQHYGVMGMRWGVRHDKQYQGTLRGLKQQRKAGKLTKQQFQAKKTDAKVDTANRLYATNSKATNRRIQSRSTAKTLGMTALHGSYGTLHYDRARTEGKGRLASWGRGYGARLLNVAGPNMGGQHGIASGMNYSMDKKRRELGQKSGDTNRSYSLHENSQLNQEVAKKRAGKKKK